MNIQKFVDCAVFEKHMYAFQSGDLSAEDQSLLQRHCEECETCTHLLEIEASFLRGLQVRLRRVPAPVGLKARIRADLAAGTSRRPRVFSWLMSPLTAGLTTALLLAVVFIARPHQQVESGTPGEVTDGWWDRVPVTRTAVLVDFECDQGGLSIEQQVHCDSDAHVNALKLADGQYMQFDLNDPQARELALAQRRRGERLKFSGRFRPESGTIELSSIEPAADAL